MWIGSGSPVHASLDLFAAGAKIVGRFSLEFEGISIDNCAHHARPMAPREFPRDQHFVILASSTVFIS